ncbi:MAG TPA: MFS transporter [Ktedonobacterales bacterium]|nr:MFS transporter [Ktedonobacterales bacterium]
MLKFRGHEFPVRLPGVLARTSGARKRPSGSESGIFSALRYRNYRLFWLGQLVSVTGTFMQSTAQQWLVLTLDPNPLALGIVGALQFGPLLVLAPFGGAIADRWPRRNVLVATQVSAGLLAFILWILTATGLVALWHVFVLALLLGIVNAVDMPTRQAFVSEMVPRKRLLNAISLNSAQFNASRVLGPGLAGGLIALFGVPPLFVLNALSYVAVIFGLLMMHTDELVPFTHAEMGHGMARFRAIGDGMRYVLAKPRLRVTFLLVAVAGTLGFNFNVLLPLEATQVLHQGPAIFGLLTSALGIGALLGALRLAKRGGEPTNRILTVTSVAFGALLASLAFTPTVALTLLALIALGFAMSSFGASANTRMQISSPPELRGRVMSLYTMVFVGTTPIGNLIVGIAAAQASVGAAFLIAGVPTLAAGLLAGFLWHRQAQRAAMTESPTSTNLPVMPPLPADAPPMTLPAEPDMVRPESRRSAPLLGRLRRVSSLIGSQRRATEVAD